MSPKDLLKIDITQEEYLKLIYKVFNTEEGQLLLDVWTKQFMFRKTAVDGDDLLSIGLKQGEQQFVMSIIQLMEQTEKMEDNNGK